MLDAVEDKAFDLDFTPFARADVKVLPMFLTLEEDPLNADMKPLILVSASVLIACTNVPTPFALTESVAVIASTRLLTAVDALATLSGFTFVTEFEYPDNASPNGLS